MLNIFAQNVYCWYIIEPPRQGSSNEYPHSMFWSKKKNRYSTAYPCFAVLKWGSGGGGGGYSLHGHVFLMFSCKLYVL